MGFLIFFDLNMANFIVSMKEICKTCNRVVDETEFSEMMDNVDLNDLNEKESLQKGFFCLECIRSQ